MIVLDTNIYISALNFAKGKPHQILQLAQEGELNIAISDAILEEVLRVMSRKFLATAEELLEAESLINECTQRVNPVESLKVIAEDADDDRILECAVASGARIIVSGDKDLLRLREYAGIAILSAAEFLERRAGALGR